MTTLFIPARLERVGKNSIITVAWDPADDHWVLIERKASTGKTRPLRRATALADVAGLDIVTEALLRQGAAVSSRAQLVA